MKYTQFKGLSTIESDVQRFRAAWTEGLTAPNTLATTREGEISCLVNIYCAPTREQALAELKPHWEWYAERARDFYFSDTLKSMGGTVPEEYLARVFPGYPDPQWKVFVEHGMVCVGSPEDCYKYVATLNEYGVDTFFGMFQIGAMPFDKVMASLELFGKEVAPHFLKQPARAG